MNQNQLASLRSLETMINLTHYSAFIGKKTKYGDKPHKHNPAWGWTKVYLAQNPTPSDIGEIVATFKALACDNEIAAAEFIVLNDRYIQQDF